ncbi:MULTISPECIES: hypothetical protein [unclassified Arthrobacter]|uniref:hypothetical protein n=1 Tax=unclassified Arthrobacter TaxID=235627 RepID=UPI000CE3FD19|nr:MULTISPECIES: hypothetical protein [unclassified Arthrobacter]
MGSDREEKIDQWIFQEGVKKDRRNKIIPSSTDSITHTPVGTALDAMEKIAFYFGDRPELPIVELGLIKVEEITLTFGGDVHLDPPFWQVSEEHQDHWGITHNDALGLSTGTIYGEQTAALTAIGNSLAGAKVLLNTNRWQVLGSAGLDRFSTALMVGQVMEQATEPWAKEHHIWLVGYRELGPKLVNFLTHYHDESRFHLVESVEQIIADDLAGTTSTLYVMGSSDASLKSYERLRGLNVGMLTDTVVTELAMFISEDDDGGATILNATPDGMKIWPNLVGEGDALYEAMELTWKKHLEEAKEAQQAVESLTIEDFLPATPAAPKTSPEATPSISVAELEALVNFESVTPDHEKPAEPEPAQAETIQAEPAAAAEPEPAEPAPEPPAAAAEPEQAEPEPAQAEPVQAEPAAKLSQNFAAPLCLLGQPQLHSDNGSAVTGKPAEAVAYLSLNGRSSDAVELSQKLWPEAENEGNTARIRRSRTAKKIKEALPASFRNDTAWEIDHLDTDLNRIINALTQEGNPQATLVACHSIQTPLQGCAEWADEHRDRIVQQLRQVLDDTTGRALENDQFEIAKAARQASKKL